MESEVMNVDLLKQIRNILLRTALITLILAWLLAGMTIGLWDVWSTTTSQWFRTPTAELGPMISNWFALIKFYLIFVLLAPALGLHWEIKKRQPQSGAS
jgi:hypothetical protein